MAKRVQLDITFTLGGTDYKASLNSCAWKVNREKVDVTVFGNLSDRYELGKATWSFDLGIRPDADQAFVKFLLQRIEDGADVALVHRPQNAAEGTTNPTVAGSVKVQGIPDFGGAHGALQGEGTITLEGNSACTWDDGATTITIG